MAWRGSLKAIAAVAGLVVPALVLTQAALADHGDCPLFERQHYDYTIEFNLGGDLYATEHYQGFADFRQCFQMRDRLLEAEVRYDARGGSYALRVMGDGFDDMHALLHGTTTNQTPWYDLNAVESVQFAGIARNGNVTTHPGLPDAAQLPTPAAAVVPALR